jgi:hypothetical protein
VGATVKGLGTQVKKNAVYRKKGYTTKRYKGLDKAPVFPSEIATFTDQRDYRFKSGQQVSRTTLEGPVVLAYEGTWNGSTRGLREVSPLAEFPGEAVLPFGQRGSGNRIPLQNR